MRAACLNDDIAVVIGSHVIEAHKTWHVLCPLQSARPRHTAVQGCHLGTTEGWVQNVPDVVQRPLHHFVPVWQTEHL